MAIQQHPLPQDISSYRFRLIGDMTIKQFAFLAGFIIVGVIFYSSPLPFFFKYPLAFISVCLGIGIAFVPVQGRSLEQWIIAFIKSIYSPTQYVWRQTKISDSTSETSTNQPTAVATTQTIAPTPAPTQTAPVVVEIPEKNVIPQTSQQPTATIPASETSTQAISEPQTPKQPYTSTVEAKPTPEVQTQTSLPTPTTGAINATTTPAPSINLPIPFTPTTPNTLVGLTLTPEGKILENVMVEIQSKGLTIRATRSNRLGQFMFARPLEDGLYQILAEKEGVNFAAYSLQLTGAIVKPLKIQAEK